MRRCDDPVEVRRGLIAGSRGELEGPEQFLWRGRLWKVRDVIAHDRLAEREVWRVAAGRGLVAVGEGGGIFDLVFDCSRGSWQLVRTLD